MAETDKVVRQDILTGEVFVRSHAFQQPIKTFQLEAIIDGKTTRLQVDGEVPEACLFDEGHYSGLKITGVMESLPPQYNLGCDCGYSVTAHDVNQLYVPFNKRLESQDNPKNNINELVDVVNDAENSSGNSSQQNSDKDYASTIKGMKSSAFVGGIFAGALIEGVVGPDSNVQNVVDSVFIGSLSTWLATVFDKVPGLRWLSSSRGNLTDWEYFKVRTPPSIAGIMVGQTVVKYLKQVL